MSSLEVVIPVPWHAHVRSASPRWAALRTAALFSLLSGLAVAVGYWFGGRVGLTLGLVLALAVSGVAYIFGDRLALRAVRAFPIGEAQAPDIYRIVRELCRRTRQPVPRIYVAPTGAPNAFATGRNPRSASLCLTSGLLHLLDERELRGVIAHELAHIRSRDTVVTSAVAGMASLVMYVAFLAWFLPLGDDDESNPFAALALLALGPVAAGLLQFAISRSRETDADRMAAAVTGDPLGLAAALQAIEEGVRRRPMTSSPHLRPASALMIASPFTPRGMTRLFATHPPTADRIARLQALARDQF